MSAPYARQAQVALLVLFTVTFLGGWNMPTGSGTWLAQAQADDRMDDKDHKDYDKDYDKNDYDHLACYEVRCIDRYDKDGRKVTQCDSDSILKFFSLAIRAVLIFQVLHSIGATHNHGVAFG